MHITNPSKFSNVFNEFQWNSIFLANAMEKFSSTKTINLVNINTIIIVTRGDSKFKLLY